MTKGRPPKAQKSCPTCGETDLAMFASDASRKNDISIYCLTCKRAQSNAWYAAHKSIVSTRRKTKRDQPA